MIFPIDRYKPPKGRRAALHGNAAVKSKFFLPKAVKHRAAAPPGAGRGGKAKILISIIHNLAAKGNSGVKDVFCAPRPAALFPPDRGQKSRFLLHPARKTFIIVLYRRLSARNAGAVFPCRIFPLTKWRRITGGTWRIEKWAAPCGAGEAGCPARIAGRSIAWQERA